MVCRRSASVMLRNRLQKRRRSFCEMTAKYCHFPLRRAWRNAHESRICKCATDHTPTPISNDTLSTYPRLLWRTGLLCRCGGERTQQRTPFGPSMPLRSNTFTVAVKSDAPLIVDRSWSDLQNGSTRQIPPRATYIHSDRCIIQYRKERIPPPPLVMEFFLPFL